MRHLRNYLIAVLAWLFFLYNIERISAPINIASFVYAYVACCAILVLLLHRLQNLPFLWLFILALVPYFVLKAVQGQEIAGINLPITVTEICAIGVTISLTRHIGQDLVALQEEISQLAVSYLNAETPNFAISQSQIYREIRRARRYQRPATLLAISATEKSIELSLHRFILEAKNNITKKYIASRIAKLLHEELKDSDVIAQRNNDFIVLLPETTFENAAAVVNRIKASAEEKLNLTLRIGFSTFPKDALTFTQLLENAETNMSYPSALVDIPGESAADKPTDVQPWDEHRIDTEIDWPSQI